MTPAQIAETLAVVAFSQELWLAGLKRRYGIRCHGDPAVQDQPQWPVLPEGTQPGDWQLVEVTPAMVSPDLVRWFVVPDGQDPVEFLDSLQADP